MQLLIILALILFFALTDAVIYVLLRSRAYTKISQLNANEDYMYNEIQELNDEVKELKNQEDRLRKSLVLLEKEESEASQLQEQSDSLSAEAILLQEDIVSSQQLHKAQKYLENNHSSMHVLDALILLDIIDLDTASYVRSKLKESS